jgi:hypothetical protein
MRAENVTVTHSIRMFSETSTEEVAEPLSVCACERDHASGTGTAGEIASHTWHVWDSGRAVGETDLGRVVDPLTRLSRLWSVSEAE